MFSNEDKTQFIADLTWAAEVQDSRAILRLAVHAEDMGIITEIQAREITSTATLMYSCTNKQGQQFSDSLVALANRI